MHIPNWLAIEYQTNHILLTIFVAVGFPNCNKQLINILNMNMISLPGLIAYYLQMMLY